MRVSCAVTPSSKHVSGQSEWLTTVVKVKFEVGAAMLGLVEGGKVSGLPCWAALKPRTC